ncbi:magnesium transporter NIPA-domain-containing protein [Mariannaea sp. PMI_226]|nr:magnesium transporter NIPA-domain-containing protein [Mariannaea sp. PMI_226]
MDIDLFERSGVSIGTASDRPGWYKAVGIGLAVGSGLFIGVSFVLKKVGLLRANEKYNEVAGEGYGYLKNAYWWGGMTLMIIGEICNFVAYAFTDAILVTPLGALSVVITTVLSAIFLKERLSMVGKVACFLCIVGSVVIVMNAPQTSSVSDIQQMQHYVITPGFLSYTGVILVGSAITAFWAGPKWGKKNMLVYISICSWVGGLSVVSTQGIGAAIIAWIDGKPQYKEWFFWVLLAFVICTLLTEIIYLNKALNLFNAALVTPTYYVYFTSTTIITSAILFQGFKGTVTSIVTVVLGFLTICSGVVLLQLSKSAKDVPDAAVFSGDLDQIHTIAEQEQPESEPKADAIRGTAAIMRQISQRRLRMEADELKRMNEEKAMMETMEPISEDGQPQWEWDGLRRRQTMTFRTRSIRSRPITSPAPPTPRLNTPNTPRSAHPPLGMSHFPTEDDYDDHDRSTIFSSIAGTIRRNRGMSKGSSLLPYDEHPEGKVRSPMHPVPLTEIALPRQKPDDEAGAYYGQTQEHVYEHDTEYRGATASSGQSLAPTPPPHGTRRQFSFTNVFRRPHSARISEPTEEERVGLVKEEAGGPAGHVRGHSHTRQDSQGSYSQESSVDDEPYEDHDDKSYDESIHDSRDGRRYDDRGHDYDRDHGRDRGYSQGRGRGGGAGSAFV